jgi:PPOX class probable F420-dependent enzyme
VTPEVARRLFASARVARLATADAEGRPHVVPLVFALAGDTVLSAVDSKPKRTRELRRLRNIAENPSVALLADHYDDTDWDALWWVRAEGEARLLEGEDATPGIALLRGRYAQYREAPPEGPVLAVAVTRWSGWHA